MARRSVFHGTWNPDFDPKNMDPEQSLHVGTRKAAEDRLRNLAQDGGAKGKAAIHEFEITKRPSPMVWADPSLDSDEANRRYKEGGRWWQAVEGNESGDITRPVRYINEYEDPGSMSYVVMPDHLSHISTQFIDFTN